MTSLGLPRRGTDPDRDEQGPQSWDLVALEESPSDLALAERRVGCGFSSPIQRKTERSASEERSICSTSARRYSAVIRSSARGRSSMWASERSRAAPST